jgi:mRNA interferase MazF
MNIKQSEIWKVNFDPTIGSEIKKTRPALIINDDALGKLPLKVILPITDWKIQYSNYPWMVKIEPDSHNGLEKTSAIDCFQIRSVSIERMTDHVGIVNFSILSQVQEAIMKVIGAE